MNDVIVIEVAANGLVPIRAGAVSVDGAWLRTIRPDDLAAEAGKETILVLDGTLVASHQVEVPAFPDAKLLRILPGLMDAKIGQAGGSPHFALLSDRDREAGGRVVAAIDADVLRTAITGAESLGLTVRCVVPDYMVLDQDQPAAVTTPEGRTLMRRADGTGVSAEADQVSYMTPADMQVKQVSEAGWNSMLARTVMVPVTLMQGAFGPRADMACWLAWSRLAMVLAMAAFMLWAGSAYYVARLNFDEADRLHTATENRFRAALPGVGRIVNMEAQMRRAVLNLREQGGSEFLVLSSLTAEVVAEQGTTMLESMRFQADSGELAISASFASFADGEQFKAMLQDQGLMVREGNSRAEGNRVMSELIIRRRA